MLFQEVYCVQFLNNAVKIVAKPTKSEITAYKIKKRIFDCICVEIGICSLFELIFLTLALCGIIIIWLTSNTFFLKLHLSCIYLLIIIIGFASSLFFMNLIIEPNILNDFEEYLNRSITIQKNSNNNDIKICVVNNKNGFDYTNIIKNGNILHVFDKDDTDNKSFIIITDRDNADSYWLSSRANMLNITRNEWEAVRNHLTNHVK